MKKNCIFTSEINKELANNKDDFILASEKSYLDDISETAEYIYKNRTEKPFVLLSGPSGSGKTTTAHKISELLVKMGVKVHIISMDNYFYPKTNPKIPKDKFGNPNFESPFSMNIELFSSHLISILNCEEVPVPVFDFITQKNDITTPLHRKNGEIVIIEGIHALNPFVVGNIHSHSTFLYVSVRTRILSADGKAIIHPRKIRLMRRLIRDKIYRARETEHTFSMYNSVTLGEDEHIIPYKKYADFHIDTFIDYEASVYAGILVNDLLAHNKDFANFQGYNDMCKILQELSVLEIKDVPKNSLIREFIGDF